MRQANRPLTHEEVRDIKVGEAFVHPGPNRQWRRSMAKAHSSPQRNRRETKGREQIKQRIAKRVVETVDGKPKVGLSGNVIVRAINSLKIIFHKRNPDT